MQVQTSHNGDREFTVEVAGEDYSLAEIIHHELLDEKNVTFAGVLPPHPLIRRLVLRVRAQRIKPEKAFLSSIEKAQETVREFLEATNKAFSGEAE